MEVAANNLGVGYTAARPLCSPASKSKWRIEGAGTSFSSLKNLLVSLVFHVGQQKPHSRHPVRVYTNMDDPALEIKNSDKI